MLKRFFIILLLPFCCSALATAAKSKGVYAVHDGNSVVIGNEFLAREFSLVNGHVRTQTIVNKRTGSEPIRIVPEISSEEFIIRTLSEDSVTAELRSSKLSLNKVDITDDGKGGKKLTFRYQSFRLGEVDWQVNMVYTLQNGKHYMRKHLEITVPDSQRSQARIDYIDFESLKLPGGYAVWTHPDMEGGVGGISSYHISLGQPLYV